MYKHKTYTPHWSNSTFPLPRVTRTLIYPLVRCRYTRLFSPEHFEWRISYPLRGVLQTLAFLPLFHRLHLSQSPIALVILSLILFHSGYISLPFTALHQTNFISVSIVVSIPACQLSQLHSWMGYLRRR
ncbi:hypothetical protein FB567DRAFT_512076 [Paraphoma chrysanthemicola]|uniref:Uncharacterized protein n=1 Tax=Paraphoma chrysanthemicola TaxID=798071 RepID=A0A8K0W4U2_9PLEO|nr:hypothetical protein FB567DRAFT_512076 [Paraphoma chrysanthemicola]